MGDEYSMIIYDGKAITVRAQLDLPGDILVATFSPRNVHRDMSDVAPEDMNAAGEEFLEKCGLPGIFFISRENHWWQTFEMEEAIAEIRRTGLLERYREVVTYGMSMGGYGALMFSKALGAKRVISVAPQYSIDSSVVPFETRWPEDRRRLKFIRDDMFEGLSKESDVYLLYDPRFRVDHLHAKLVEACRPVDSILVTHSGHRVAQALLDMGLLSRGIEGLLRGTLDAHALRRQIRQNRRLSAYYLSTMSQDVAKRFPKAAGRLAEMALAIVSEQRLKAPRPDFLVGVFGAQVTKIVLQVCKVFLSEHRYDEVCVLAETWKGALPRAKDDLDLLVVQALVAAGKRDEAATLLWRIVEQPSPLSTRQPQGLMRVALQVFGAMPGAEALLRFVEAKRKEILADEMTSVRLAELLHERRRPRDASVLFRDAALGLEGARRFDLVLRRVHGLVATGSRPEEALAEGRRMASTPRSEIDRQILLAAVFEGVGDLRSAKALWTELLAKSPGHAVVQLNLARIHLKTGDEKGARHLAEQLTTADPGNRKAQAFLRQVRGA
ncbi:tetratricopeptide repeat protein [Zavarzinia sp.]|uniref:tetratricopeptide repeat protein n=1 Tax=Zavarzinia sp. TaxID=2027920 RepID=UPI003568A76E